jgi:Cu(I)/Ag(I) efflux system membrane protein CusA/SilA
MRHAARAADHPQRAVEASIQFPPGTYVVWSGQYEYLERAKAWLQIVVPATS